MERSRTSACRFALLGVGCLAAGLALGRLLPSTPSEPVWTGPPPTRQVVAQVTSFADVVQKIGPGVVTVRARLPQPDANEKTPANPVASAKDARNPLTSQSAFAAEAGLRTGSGFVVNARGLCVTSRHVIAGAMSIDVILPVGRSCRAELVGEDGATDIALLRLVDPPAGLHALELGSSEQLRAGDWIVAVGNPFGFSQTVTAGVVSFVGRHLPHTDLRVTNDFLQISVPVNPGSSGCPVVNLQGEVVGVMTQAATNAQGISFAVPSRTLKWTLEEMERQPDGRVRRGYLGIEFASHTGVDAKGTACEGALIVAVVEGEPAHRAGLRRGDVVLRVDGQKIVDAKNLHECIVRGDPGSRIAVELLRDGRVHDPIVAVLGEVGGPKTVPSAN
jgi:serine protease Do